MLKFAKLSAATLLTFAMTAALPAFADDQQDVPSYAHAAPMQPAQGVPSYARASADQELHGSVASYDGRYELTVRDSKGYLDSVKLHQGTAINPTGLRLENGMQVTVIGDNRGAFFAAREIDTPYTIYAGVPYWGDHRWDYYGPNFYFGRWWR